MERQFQMELPDIVSCIVRYLPLNDHLFTLRLVSRTFKTVIEGRRDVKDISERGKSIRN